MGDCHFKSCFHFVELASNAERNDWFILGGPSTDPTRVTSCLHSYFVWDKPKKNGDLPDFLTFYVLPTFITSYHIISHHQFFFGYPPSSCGRWVGRTRTTRQSGRPGAQCLRNCRGRRVADLNVKKGVQTPKMDWHSPLNLMKSH